MSYFRFRRQETIAIKERFQLWYKVVAGKSAQSIMKTVGILSGPPPLFWKLWGAPRRERQKVRKENNFQ